MLEESLVPNQMPCEDQTVVRTIYHDNAVPRSIDKAVEGDFIFNTRGYCVDGIAGHDFTNSQGLCTCWTVGILTGRYIPEFELNRFAAIVVDQIYTLI